MIILIKCLLHSEIILSLHKLNLAISILLWFWLWYRINKRPLTYRDQINMRLITLDLFQVSKVNISFFFQKPFMTECLNKKNADSQGYIKLPWDSKEYDCECLSLVLLDWSSWVRLNLRFFSANFFATWSVRMSKQITSLGIFTLWDSSRMSKQYYIFTKTELYKSTNTIKELKVKSETMQETWKFRNLFVYKWRHYDIVYYNIVSI